MHREKLRIPLDSYRWDVAAGQIPRTYETLLKVVGTWGWKTQFGRTNKQHFMRPQHDPLCLSFLPTEVVLTQMNVANTYTDIVEIVTDAATGM